MAHLSYLHGVVNMAICNPWHRDWEPIDFYADEQLGSSRMFPPVINSGNFLTFWRWGLSLKSSEDTDFWPRIGNHSCFNSSFVRIMWEAYLARSQGGGKEVRVKVGVGSAATYPWTPRMHLMSIPFPQGLHQQGAFSNLTPVRLLSPDGVKVSCWSPEASPVTILLA